jgi:FkbM family methyltransferase
MRDIKTFDELYSYLENIGVVDTYKKSTAIKSLMKYYNSLLKRKKYKGKTSWLKSILVKISPIRLMMSFYDALMSYNEFDINARIKISKEAVKDLNENKDNYLNVYNLLDNESQALYVNILMFRVTGDYNYILHMISENRQYFSNKINWSESEIVVDCGAFIGDTLLEFIEQGVNIKEYYLYELEDGNFKELLKNCEKAKKIGVVIYPKQKGVYSKTKTLYYERNEDSSKLVNYKTEQSIDVVALDDDILSTITFIKMDIEGSEMEAIEGAKNIIMKYKPTLAICLYHKQKDFWEIPLKIKHICPSYSHFWIEHYTANYNETVLYVSV